MIMAFKILFTPYVKKNIDKINLRLFNLETSLDCMIERPRYAASEDAGFNGQTLRKRIFRDLVNAFGFHAIVETGTFLGDTTGYMAEASGLPVYSCELNRRFHSISKLRLSEFKTIRLWPGDSREYLRELGTGELSGKCVFFYLDSHWYEDLPIREEIRIIASHWNDFAIMIDDFKVPNDDGYGYDDYGGKKVLALKLIRDAMDEHGLVPYFPSSPSSEETGYRRGCVVLIRKKRSDTVSGLDSLSRG